MMLEKRVFIVTILAGLLFTGCASYRPIADMKGVDQAQYEQDLSECQQYAKQMNPAADTAVGAVTGAAIGAVFGVVVGAILGDPGLGASLGATYGGFAVATCAAAGSTESQINIIRRCMERRGYNILY